MPANRNANGTQLAGTRRRPFVRQSWGSGLSETGGKVLIRESTAVKSWNSVLDNSGLPQIPEAR